MTENECVIVLDFGGQYNHLIARRVREAGVYCEILPYNTPIGKIREKHPKGIIFTGGPASVFEDGAPRCDTGVYDLGCPVLGICYGVQLMAFQHNGKVKSASVSEYGRREITVKPSILFEGVPETASVWMSHTVLIGEAPESFTVTATTDSCPVAAMEDSRRKLYGVQFHPEVTHTPYGQKILENFLFRLCGLRGDWTMKSFVDRKLEEICAAVGGDKVLCALSGGVDSSVAAVLMHKAIGKNLFCIFVDHGLLRKDEANQVEDVFRREFDLNVTRIDASGRFLSKLAGVTDPEKKRKIIGEEFIQVFEEEAAKIEGVKWLLQGTIYPDIIESGTENAATIKSHHNVGGLPEKMNLKLVEPLRELFKDEVRSVGRELGLPADSIERQPFPGPGLAIRIMGEITEDKLTLLREADAIFREEIVNSPYRSEIWQYFAVLPGNRTVGVMGDERTYEYTIALRAVTSSDAMTADWARIDFDLLEKISSRIVNEVKNVNRVVYDITSKPPSTIEWE